MARGAREKEPAASAAAATSERGQSRWRLAAGIVVGVILGVLVYLTYSNGQADEAVGVWPRDDAPPERGAVAGEGVGEVMYCASCHLLPPPEILSRNEWPTVIDRMNRVIDYHRLGEPLTPEEQQRITHWYVTRAPSDVPPLTDEGNASPIRFSSGAFGNTELPAADGGPPQIGHLRIVDLDGSGEPRVLISDVGHSALMLAERDENGVWRERKLAEITAPAQVDVGDVNGNGHRDIVVADVGRVPPTDDLVGRVVLLENDGEMQFTARTLLRNLPRMSDARFADVNGNGRTDILFASFGLYRNGQVGWLEQTDEGEFEHHAILVSNGISHVRPADLTDNGLTDFVVLVSQEHQEVLAFINQGEGVFDHGILHRAPHPMWGYASMELVDLNGSGRLDVLLANGDAFDLDYTPKPWHGVQWLENLGDLAFRPHDVFNFHGAYTAVAADLTGNGHLDIVTSSMANHWDDPDRQSVIWLENDGQQRFRPRRLAERPTSQITIAVGDLTGNGRADVLGGGLYGIIERPEHFGRVTKWRNLGPTQAE